MILLHGCESVENELASHLSEDEHLRAGTFRFAEDRRRFVVSHGLLRRVVGQYLSIEPGKVRLTVEAFERPRVLGAPSPCCISLSHAGELAAIAIAGMAQVGVDVEPWAQTGSLADAEDLALSGGEASALQQMSPERRIQAFLRCWCAKEAITKALGTGLSTPLADLDIGIEADGRILRQRFAHAPSGQWFTLKHLDVGLEGCACIAADGGAGGGFDVVTGEFADFMR
jgi:4'-phosphopantetheinyl transferase